MRYIKSYFAGFDSRSFVWGLGAFMFIAASFFIIEGLLAGYPETTMVRSEWADVWKFALVGVLPILTHDFIAWWNDR